MVPLRCATAFFRPAGSAHRGQLCVTFFKVSSRDGLSHRLPPEQMPRVAAPEALCLHAKHTFAHFAFNPDTLKCNGTSSGRGWGWRWGGGIVTCCTTLVPPLWRRSLMLSQQACVGCLAPRYPGDGRRPADDKGQKPGGGASSCSGSLSSSVRCVAAGLPRRAGTGHPLGPLPPSALGAATGRRQNPRKASADCGVLCGFSSGFS